MSHKARRFDLSPDNFIGGVSGVLTAPELGVYWAICLLVYSHGGPIVYDELRLKSFLRGTHLKAIRCAVVRLESLGKVDRNGIYIMAKGCLKPIEDASNRVIKAIENGSKGGRPPSNNNNLEKAAGLSGENPISTTITTTTSSKKEESKKVSPAKAVAVKVTIIGFNEFYQVYPKRVGKGAAEKAYRKAVMRADHSIIFAGACRHATATIGQDRQFIQHPATWLNADGWLDEIQPQTNGAHNGRTHKQSAHSKFAEGAYLAAIEPEPGMENSSFGGADAVGYPLLEARLRTEPD